MEAHELANLFPMLPEQELNGLAEDIKENGLLEPIITYEGKILDGRNRYKACQQAGIEPHTEEYKGEKPLEYVLSLNLHRRHLNESQRAMVASRIANMPKGSNQHASIEAPSQSEAAKMLNVSRSAVQRARVVQETAEPEVIEAIDRGELTVSKVVQQQKKQERIEDIQEICEGTPELPNKKYAVVYADPPWRYDYAQSDSRAIENKYPTMSLQEICELEVSELCSDPAILFMWTTTAKLAESFEVVEAWGFTYRSSMIWVKDKIGMGYWVRNKHEILLICTRGNMPVPEASKNIASVIEAKRGEHSAKPEVFRETIERMFPTLPKIELFCREPKDGWESWGKEA